MAHFQIKDLTFTYPTSKGKKSLVPDFVAAEIERSIKAQEKMDENMEQMLEASK